MIYDGRAGLRPSAVIAVISILSTEEEEEGGGMRILNLSHLSLWILERRIFNEYGE